MVDELPIPWPETLKKCIAGLEVEVPGVNQQRLREQGRQNALPPGCRERSGSRRSRWRAFAKQISGLVQPSAAVSIGEAGHHCKTSPITPSIIMKLVVNLEDLVVHHRVQLGDAGTRSGCYRCGVVVVQKTGVVHRG